MALSYLYIYTHPKQDVTPYAVCAATSEKDLNEGGHPNLVYYKQIKPLTNTSITIDSCIEKLPICDEAKTEVRKIIELLREEKNEQ